MPFDGPELAGAGSPGPPAGAKAASFACTVPSGATVRMSSFVLFELKVIECGPMTHQVTEPPTGILTTLGPNSVISASWTLFEPEPASTGLEPGRVRPGTGGFPCFSACTAVSSLASIEASCVCPAAYCAAGLATLVPAGSTTTLPVMLSRCRRHMKRYVPGAIELDRWTVNRWFELSQPLL